MEDVLSNHQLDLLEKVHAVQLRLPSNNVLSHTAAVVEGCPHEFLAG